MDKVRVGIIATGSIARAHARGYRAHPEYEIAAIADSNAEALSLFGDQYNVDPTHRYLDLREMLDREHLDVVSVCSWHGQHAEMTIAAAARSPKLILCEKPMAVNLGEADNMIVAARRNKVKLAIGHMRRFYRGWELARELVADGAIGAPQRAWSQIHDGLLNWGTHTLDGLLFVLGDPKVEWVMGNIERKTDRYERAMRIEDACMGLMQLSNGCQVLIESDLTKYGSINFTIYGSEGTIVIDENTVKLMNASTQGWKQYEIEQNDPFVGQARGLLDWLNGTVTEYRGEATLARATLEALLAVYESARLHEAVKMPLLTRVTPIDLLVEQGHVPVQYPGAYDIRSFLVRGEAMSWDIGSTNLP
jgi:predicted dehydrogenase